MISYEKLAGVKVLAESSQRLVLTPEGQAMGHIPGWKALIDPAYPVGSGTRNRALPSNVLAGTRALTYATIGALPAFSMTGTLRQAAPVAKFDLNPNAWTWFAAVKNEVVSPAGAGYFVGPIASITTGVPLYILLRGSGQLSVSTELATGSTVYRINADNVAAPGSSTVLCMVTFSTTEGLKIFKNGNLVAENKTDLRALTTGYKKDELLVMMTGASGTSGYVLAGMQGFLDIDLGAAENAGYRRIVERFLMSKYGIVS